MPVRGRRIAVALITLALLLSAGRWGSEFLAERLWEASVSARVAAAGERRALLTLALELSVLSLAVVWFFVHFTIAARIALPKRPPPEQDRAPVWPAQLPRWSLAAFALVLGVLLGGGAGAWLDELLLALDGVRLGVRDPLLGADLGVFVRQVPLWLDLQGLATLLVAAALAGVVLLHVAGETIRISERRLWVSPRARGQLALLLALLALTLGWACALEPYRLAAGVRGPLLSSEFVLPRLISQIEAALAMVTALVSFLWWFRVRGPAVLALWLLFGLALLIGKSLPLRGGAAIADPAWLSAARGLDSVAFQLAGLEGGGARRPDSAAALTPTLWDETWLPQALADSGRLSDPMRGWIGKAARREPVWFAVRELRGQTPALLALSDDRVSPSGAPLSWHEADSVPIPGVVAFRELPPRAQQPLARRIELSPAGPGVSLDNWPRRIVLAWSLQAPAAFSAPRGTRIAWRLDPSMRLHAVAPFVHWTPPRARVTGAGLVWQSDGLLTASLFPSSARVPWGAGRASMVRSTFLAVVNAASGEVRIFRRDPADSLAAAWARIRSPLIEPPEAIPPELRAGEAYPEELLLAQAQVLEGAPWAAGRLERVGGGLPALPPAAPGGTEHVVPFLRDSAQTIGTVLHAWRTAAGDSLRLVRLDSLWIVESAATLIERWKRFPWQSALRDSIMAVGASFEAGRVRYALTAEGVVAYQPAWSVLVGNHVQLVLVNVALGRPRGPDRMSLGAGRTFAEAWRNFRGEIFPSAVGTGPQGILEQARRLMRHADSALKRGDLQELGRTLAYLRDLLEPRIP